MKKNTIVRVLVLAIVAAIGITPAFAADEYRFKVHNNTDKAITKILVSEDGEEYGFFDIGKGIAPGATAELVWAESTDGENCAQHFKAVFAGGTESEPVAFDFCEAGLTLEFE